MDIVKLRELLESELSSEEPVRLDSGFYNDFRSLIKAYEARAESSRSRGESVEERLYLERIKIAEHLIKEIIRLRLHKIVELAFKGAPVELPPEERDLLLLIKSFLEEGAVKLAPAPPEEVKDVETNEKAEERGPVGGPPITHAYVVMSDLPSIMAPDMQQYGPMRSGDMVVLPEDVGRVLVERKVAFRISLRF